MHAVAPPTLPITGSHERFPLRRVYCVGRNYADHAREMGGEPDREPPFFFTKPADAVFVPDEGFAGGPVGVVPYPPQTANLHHEVELVVALAEGGVDVPVEHALDLVYGYAVGVDLTRRDLQDAAKASRRPWDLSKGFDASGPCSPLTPAVPNGWRPTAGRIRLEVDGAVRQDGDLADQIWSVAEILAELSRSVELAPGDVIFTGTPAGVGPVPRGAVVTASIDGVASLRFTVQ
jgi:fumarylpyruvate hydrolase